MQSSLARFCLNYIHCLFVLDNARFARGNDYFSKFMEFTIKPSVSVVDSEETGTKCTYEEGVFYCIAHKYITSVFYRYWVLETSLFWLKWSIMHSKCFHFLQCYNIYIYSLGATLRNFPFHWKIGYIFWPTRYWTINLRWQ